MSRLSAYLSDGVELALGLANALSTFSQGAETEPSGSETNPAAQQFRDVFAAQRLADVGARLNVILHAYGAKPTLMAEPDGRWRLHLHTSDASVEVRKAVKAASGLATLLDDDLWYTVKQCAADKCDDYFVDGSRNQSRCYCSRRCANRLNAQHFRQRAGG